jgi:hypothetical protein
MTAQNRAFNGTSLSWNSVTFAATEILSVKPDFSVKGIDVSGAYEDEIVEPGQQKDTLTMECVGAAKTSAIKTISDIVVTRADGTTRTMTNMCLLKIGESGSKNAPWTTTYSFEKAHPLST